MMAKAGRSTTSTLLLAHEMTTTPTREGFIVPVEFLGWTADDWADGYSASPYAWSVMAAAGADCLLSVDDACKVLMQHSVSVSAYAAELEEAAAAGLICLPITHAGQLLTWLGW